MSILPPLVAQDARDQFVVSLGKSGALGVFTAPEPLRLCRGQRVLIQTTRGIEVGSVLCPASLQQARILGAVSSGSLLRPLSPQDEFHREQQHALEQEIFETSRAWATRDNLALEIIDAEFLFDGEHAIVQFVGPDTDCEPFAQALERHFGLTIRLENLAPPHVHEEESSGCDKPDCGRSADGSGGGCTTCSTGGGCSSCGSGKVDMRQYFGHLREKMEAPQRIALI